jgi:hypothetical protein
VKPEEIGRMSSSFREDLANLGDSLQDKGWKYFQRPILLGLIMSLATYQLLYHAPVRRLVDIQGEIEASEATVKYAPQYKDLKERLAILYSMLPRTKDPEAWLLNAIRESLREEGIVPISFSPARSTRVEGYRFLSISVNCNASYKQLGSWIARLERGDALMYVDHFELQKRPKTPGVNVSQVTITTVVSEGGPEDGTEGAPQ